MVIPDFIAELRSVGQVTTSTASSETAKPSIVKKIRPQRADMEAKQKEWDEETDRRIAETKEKFINQLVTLRTEKVEESNQKFEKSLADLDIQADALLGKLQKYFGKKLSASEKTDEEVKEMLTDFENVGKSAVKKITDATKSFKEELGQFNMTMERREKMMIVALQKSLTAHANAYETAMGIPWSYTVGVTRHDWTRYHALGKRCAAASIDMEAIRTGSIKVKELRKLQVYQNLEGFAEDADSLLDQFKDLIKRTLKKGQEKIEREKKASNLAAEEEPLASPIDKEAVSASEVASESAHGVSSVVDSPDPIATKDLVPESNESGPTTAVEPEEVSEKPSTSGPVDADDDVESPSPDAPDESINGNSSGNNSPAGAIPEEPIETEREAMEEIASELGTEVVPEEEEQHEPIINGDSGEEMVPPSSNKDEEDTTPAKTATLADTEIDGSTPADPELDGTTPVELPVDVDVAVEDGKTQISVEDAVEDSITSPDAEELSKEDPTSVEEEQEVKQEENRSLAGAYRRRN
ncbi:hypothetical protein BT69DRAFT_266011 [Atractiella rhizophila]|nr:hypothetical protein BT69DRAFT_266011 [Atractiella rhizophila]